MVKVKKISKYSKYFFFLSLTALVSFFTPTGTGDKFFSVRSAHADVPHTLGGALFCSDWGNPYPDGTCSDDSGDGAGGDADA